MPYRNQLLLKRNPSERPSSQQILKRFNDPFDCLTAHLVLECSEVLAGVKPAKDVAAFMGMVKLQFTCQGPWKIYGNPVQSLALADQYRCCRNRMSAILASGNSKSLELDNLNHPFFCHSIENDYQYLNASANEHLA